MIWRRGRSVVPEPFAAWLDALECAERLAYALLAARISYILNLADVLLSSASEGEKAGRAAALAMLVHELEFEAGLQCGPLNFVDRLRRAYELESRRASELEREVSGKFPRSSAPFKALAARSRAKARCALAFGEVLEKLAYAFAAIPRGSYAGALLSLEWGPARVAEEEIDAEEYARRAAKLLTFVLALEVTGTARRRALLPWWLRWFADGLARSARGGDAARSLKWAVAAALEGFAPERRWVGAGALEEARAAYARLNDLTTELLRELLAQPEPEEGAPEGEPSAVESGEAPEVPAGEPEGGEPQEEGARREEEEEGGYEGYEYEDSYWERRLDEDEREVRESWLDDRWDEQWLERHWEQYWDRGYGEW